jgi:hypothetical protein
MSNQPVSVLGSPAASVQDEVDMITLRGNSSNTINNNNGASQDPIRNNNNNLNPRNLQDVEIDTQFRSLQATMLRHQAELDILQQTDELANQINRRIRELKAQKRALREKLRLSTASESSVRAPTPASFVGNPREDTRLEPELVHTPASKEIDIDPSDPDVI